MDAQSESLIEKAKLERKQISKALEKGKKRPKEFDEFFHGEHDRFFRHFDCLTCANCCKTTSPIFRAVDIKRIAKQFRIKEQEFIKQYLKIDDDQDYVLKSSPCVFLDEDNCCSIYEDRPLACREYPHTDRKQVVQINALTLENTAICPAVAHICLQLVQNSK